MAQIHRFLGFPTSQPSLPLRSVLLPLSPQPRSLASAPRNLKPPKQSQARRSQDPLSPLLLIKIRWKKPSLLVCAIRDSGAPRRRPDQGGGAVRSPLERSGCAAPPVRWDFFHALPFSPALLPRSGCAQGPPAAQRGAAFWYPASRSARQRKGVAGFGWAMRSFCSCSRGSGRGDGFVVADLWVGVGLRNGDSAGGAPAEPYRGIDVLWGLWGCGGILKDYLFFLCRCLLSCSRLCSRILKSSQFYLDLLISHCKKFMFCG